ncbi:hypothetical protein An09g05810 [Aspergillus niger]|uniref:Uncharacterized protein n=2 Tax=Aspergillus niger TaxID=5061 RepID=A2QUJ0_ASPNC|nr:hypothetical protein An09g05810 [Aspergillus niger]CAK40388.1 hypothetical protein An09g05810 [Aspergillus niger]
MESRRERICAWFTADGRGPASDAKNTWRRARSTKKWSLVSRTDDKTAGEGWEDSEGGEIDDDRAKGPPASRWTVTGQAEMNSGGLGRRGMRREGIGGEDGIQESRSRGVFRRGSHLEPNQVVVDGAQLGLGAD